MKRVFIDGRAGTTGLRIYDRLSDRDDIELIFLSDEQRKEPKHRKAALNEADIAFLCLPDAAAEEAVAMVVNPDTVIIDTSCAHRVDPKWAYGFPELSPTRYEAICYSKRITVPGCHASGFIALVYPLIESGIIGENAMLCCHSLTGYSGGGKKMIDEYESDKRSRLLSAPRQYALPQQHKHLKEMKDICRLDRFPVFNPIVADFYSGMEVTVPIFKEQLNDGYGLEDIRKCYMRKYNGPVVKYFDDTSENGFLSAAVLSGSDSMAVSVFGNDDRILLTAVYDNLGKGASGAALECMNLVTGEDIAAGLELFR